MSEEPSARVVPGSDPGVVDQDVQPAEAGDHRVHGSLHLTDVANLALFLASDESRTITGQSIVVDAGGQMLG